MVEEKKNRERAEARKSQVGSGDRSERIRTYNFPQNRLTAHRINLTLYKLELIMAGQLDEVVEALKIAAGESGSAAWHVDAAVGRPMAIEGGIGVALVRASGYWRGNENNKQLTRVYGICFPKKGLLDEYLVMLEEAK